MSEPEYTLTKHRGKLALTYYPGGVQRKLSTGTDDPIRAEAIARRIWDKLHQIQNDRIENLWPAYVRDRIKDGVLAPRFSVTWKALGPFFGRMIGSSVTLDDCRAYAKQRRSAGKAASTITTELSLLRACLKWHYGDAAPRIWIPPASAPRDHWLTKDQVRELLSSTASPHIALFIILASTTGARAFSILDLTWDRVDFDTGLINFQPAGRATTNKRRTIVPMNSTARQALEEAFTVRLTDHVIEYNGQPITTVKKALQRLSAKTGIKVSPHVLRHSAAVWMAQAGVSMEKISEFLGHTSILVTRKYYARFSPTYMREASEATTL